MSGTSSTNNLSDTMSCRIPITPALGSVLNATAKGAISDPTLTKLGIRAIHIDGIVHRVTQLIGWLTQVQAFQVPVVPIT